MKFEDKDGYGFTAGCLVKVAAVGKPWRGWITGIDEERGLLLVVCERRAGAPRYVKPGEALVVKPTSLDHARRAGVANMAHDMSEKLRRARRLLVKKKD